MDPEFKLWLIWMIALGFTVGSVYGLVIYLNYLHKKIKKQGNQIKTILNWRRNFIKTGRRK